MRKTVLPLVTALCLALAGCVTVRPSGFGDRDLPEPSARTVADGVETWDLTARPSAEDIGFTDDSRLRIFETDEARTIELLLPGGASVRFQARLLTFNSPRGADGGDVNFGVRGATVDPVELDTQLRDLLGQLDVPTDVVDEFSEEVAAAPADQTERIRLSSPTATFGDLRLGVGANLAPIAGAGRYTLGGVWS